MHPPEGTERALRHVKNRRSKVQEEKIKEQNVGSNKKSAELALRIIAARAEQLADMMANNQLWPGDLEAGLNEIAKQLSEAKLGQ